MCFGMGMGGRGCGGRRIGENQARMGGGSLKAGQVCSPPHLQCLSTCPAVSWPPDPSCGSFPSPSCIAARAPAQQCAGHRTLPAPCFPLPAASQRGLLPSSALATRLFLRLVSCSLVSSSPVSPFSKSITLNWPKSEGGGCAAPRTGAGSPQRRGRRGPGEAGGWCWG